MQHFFFFRSKEVGYQYILPLLKRYSKTTQYACIILEHPNKKWLYECYRFSLTKKCSTRKLITVNPPKNIPSSAMLGHQNESALRPNVLRIVAAGTSRSTPYCRH